MGALWHLGLAAWQIQDGRPDVSVGDELLDAIECGIGDWQVADVGTTPSARPITECRYAVNARLLAHPDPYFFDIGGLIVGSHGWPRDSFDRREQLRDGDVLASEFWLGIDPMGLQHYAGDRLRAARRWRVVGISLLTGPWIESPDGWVRDPERSTWLPIERTQAHTPAEDHGSYVLDCELAD